MLEGTPRSSTDRESKDDDTDGGDGGDDDVDMDEDGDGVDLWGVKRRFENKLQVPE
jgi:hypothetical protein